MITARTRSIFACLLAASAVGLMASCNVLTPVAYAIDGPGQIDAEYTLPDKKTVVFVDAPDNILPRTALLTAIGDALSFDLMQRELLTATVATRDAIAVARAGAGASASKKVSNESIARALDASQVIHISPVIFDLEGRTDAQGIRPTATVRVRVLDIDAKSVSYPSPEIMPKGREVVVSIRSSEINALATRAGRTVIEDELAKKLSVKIGQLFYKHDRIDLGENLGTRKK